MEEPSEEGQEQVSPPESEPESPVEFLSPEEQEQVMHEYAQPQLEGMERILAEKRAEFSSAVDEERRKVLRFK